MDFISRFFSPDESIPHGDYYLWNPYLLRLHIISDALIALAYLAVPLTLLYIIRKRKDIPFDRMLVCIAIFTLACGATHAFEILVIWHPYYWISGGVKAVAAAASITIAIMMIRIVPKILALPSRGTAKAANETLENEIAERKRAVADLAHERDLLNTLMENSPDFIYFKDRDSRFIKTSRTLAERFQKRSTAEMVGMSDFDGLDDECARPYFEDEQRIVLTGQPILGKVEKQICKGDDKVSWMLTSKAPLRSTAGDIIGTFGISKDITEIKEAEAKLDLVHGQLLETSRQAGMAEVATSVLHNVGNVLNSVNISCSVIFEKVQKSRVGGVAKVAELLREHEGDLAAFLAGDSVGQKLPEYLAQLAVHLSGEQAATLKEIHLLSQNIEHIKEIISVQQSYGRVSGVRETLEVKDLMEDALRMNIGALERHAVEVVREYSDAPPMSMEKHRVMQILVNLVSNAKYALSASSHLDKRISIRIARNDGHVAVNVSDNGIGISPDNMTRIFAHGFTTKKDGHGFGLHGAALAAREMGGRLTVYSDGPGAGATFTLELPINAES